MKEQKRSMAETHLEKELDAFSPSYFPFVFDCGATAGTVIVERDIVEGFRFTWLDWMHVRTLNVRGIDLPE